MRLLETARFEIAYQARRPWTWLYFAVLLALSLQIVLEAYTGGARDGGYAFNSPFVITSITVLTGAMGLLVSAALAGDAGARDVQTRMHPLLYTTPTSRRAYLTGRFLAAFVLNALVLTSVQLALLLSAVMPGLEPDLLGPFRPAAYLGAYFVYALPTAFATTALLFSLAALGRRAIASYLGAVLLFFASMFVWFIVAQKLQQWELARLLDPLGLTILSEISRGSTAAEKNVLATFFTRSLFLNRALWVGIAIGVLALTQLRFRFEHATPGGWWSRRAEARDAAEAVGRPIEASCPDSRYTGYVRSLVRSRTITAKRLPKLTREPSSLMPPTSTDWLMSMSRLFSDTWDVVPSGRLRTYTSSRRSSSVTANEANVWNATEWPSAEICG